MDDRVLIVCGWVGEVTVCMVFWIGKKESTTFAFIIFIIHLHCSTGMLPPVVMVNTLDLQCRGRRFDLTSQRGS